MSILTTLLAASTLAPQAKPHFSLTLIPQENYYPAQIDDSGNIVGNLSHFKFDRKTNKLTLVKEIQKSIGLPLTRIDSNGCYFLGSISAVVMNGRGEIISPPDGPGVLGLWDMNSRGDIAGIRRKFGIPTVFVQKSDGRTIDVISENAVRLPATVVLNDRGLVAYTSETLWEQPTTASRKGYGSIQKIKGFTVRDLWSGREASVHTDTSQFWRLNRLDRSDNVVGVVWEPLIGPRGFVAYGSNLRYLFADNGSSNTYAADSNGEWVVGWTFFHSIPTGFTVNFTDAHRPMIWTADKSLALEPLCTSLPKDWRLLSADAVNQYGDIVGRVKIGNKYYGFVAKNE